MINNKLETWKNKVLESYLDGIQIIRIPASRKKRFVVLRWLVRKFELNLIYKESQVNEIISNHHSDFATLRSELIGYQLMERENSLYWRLTLLLYGSQKMKLCSIEFRWVVGNRVTSNQEHSILLKNPHYNIKT